MGEVHVIPDPVHAGRDAANAPLISVNGVDKVFGARGVMTDALSDVSLKVERGEFVAIMGPSGSGKTTLLNCISTIDKPTSGSIVINGKQLATMGRRAQARFRREELGFIFQDANLLDTLSGYENIALAMTIEGADGTAIDRRVHEVAERLGVVDCLQKRPDQMSGGQMQRVAAARAIAGDPTLILADEPTGALDSRNATVMLDTLSMMNSGMGATILMVTHDAFAASFTSRVLFLRDGRIFNEIRRGSKDRRDYFARIMEVISFLGGDIADAS